MEARPASPRVRSAAVLAPIAGLFLLMPPFILLFATPRMVFGIPLVVLYMFGVWALLIAVTWQLTRRLAARDAEAAHTDGGPPPA